MLAWASADERGRCDSEKLSSRTHTHARTRTHTQRFRHKRHHSPRGHCGTLFLHPVTAAAVTRLIGAGRECRVRGWDLLHAGQHRMGSRARRQRDVAQEHGRCSTERGNFRGNIPLGQPCAPVDGDVVDAWRVCERGSEKTDRLRKNKQKELLLADTHKTSLG